MHLGSKKNLYKVVQWLGATNFIGKHRKMEFLIVFLSQNEHQGSILNPHTMYLNLRHPKQTNNLTQIVLQLT